jgi:hypothetical protein
LAIALLSACSVYGQTAAGEINGFVTDKTGGAVAGATVRLTNQGTQVVDRTQTNASGHFLFINVKPGSYSLGVEMPGFKVAQVPAFDLAVNQLLTQNVVLDVGSAAETITVTTEAPLLQQSSTELGSVISEQAVKELPLNGRNFTQLMILTPGANPVSTAQDPASVSRMPA